MMKNIYLLIIVIFSACTVKETADKQLTEKERWKQHAAY
ncbi:MAG: hypothetical protein ACJA2S_005145, partial [Cyclobacteriaceae bacterium]